MEPLTRRVHGWEDGSSETVCGLDAMTLPTGAVVEYPDWVDHLVRKTYGVWEWCPDCERVMAPNVYRCQCTPEELADVWRREVVRSWGALVLTDITSAVKKRTPEWFAPSVMMDISPEEGIVKITVVWGDAR